MARFYAQVQGNRGMASRMGTEGSGMWAHIRGWNVGVNVQCDVYNGKDRITLSRTGGSNGGGYRTQVMILEED